MRRLLPLALVILGLAACGGDEEPTPAAQAATPAPAETPAAASWPPTSEVRTPTSVSAPVNGVIELGGPEAFRFDELVRRVLSAKNDPRQVTADAHARYYGTELEEHSLTPGSNPRIAPTRFEDWVSQSVVG